MEGRHKASEILLFEDIIYVALGTNVKECKSILPRKDAIFIFPRPNLGGDFIFSLPRST